MSNPTPTPAPALTGLPEAIREAIGALCDAEFEAGEWTGQDDESMNAVCTRVGVAHARLVAAITAALSQGVADAARLDAIERHRLRIQPDDMDGWLVRGPMQQFGMRQGYPRYGAHRLREAVDEARTALSTSRAGEASHG